MQRYPATRLLASLFLPFLVVGLLTTAARATPFTVLEGPVPGFVEPFGINNRGEIVGQFFETGGVPFGPQPFLIDAQGQFHIVDLPNVFATHDNTARDINNRGDIVGEIRFPGGFTQNTGFGYVLSRNGSLTIFQAPGAISTAATAINDRGEIAGNFTDSNGFGHLFLRHRDGTFTTFEGSGVLGLNNRGDVLVFGNGSFLRDRQGHFTAIDAPGVSGINNRGQIVGSVGLGVEHIVGFVRKPDGAFSFFDAPGSSVTVFTAINDRDVVAGIFFGEPSAEGFVASLDRLNATPEPATLLLFGTTATGLGVAAWRRRRRK